MTTLNREHPGAGPHRPEPPVITLTQLWHASAPLTATGLLMLVVLAGSLAGLAVDTRTLSGAPAWLKPAKFAASIAIYTLTLAWIFTRLAGWPRTRRFVGVVTAAALLVEIVIISMQAWRGTTSHFNVGTPFDAVLWTTMGMAILVQTLTSVAVAIALWRQRFGDPALGWALRLGMVMTILGASAGGLMARPTPRQLEEARLTGRMTTAGAHTVGAADGGPGLPVTGWSVDHGDLRVAHFAGLHALQAMLLVFLALARAQLTERARVQSIAIAAASYASLFSILLWQGLRGEGLLHPGGAVARALAAWIAGTTIAAWVMAGRRRVPAVRTAF